MSALKWFLFPILTVVTVCYSANATIAIDPYLIEEKNFIGYGANWGDYTDRVLTDTQWDRLKKRLEFMKPGMLRIMSLSYKRIGVYDSVSQRYVPGPDSSLPSVKNNIRMLEITRDLNIPVGIGWWAITSTDSSYVKLYADYLDSLITKAGYANIKMFYPRNEPKWGELSTWSDFTRKMYNAFQSRNTPIKITGPDSYINRQDTTSYGYTNTQICMNTCLTSHTGHLGYYDLHTYLDPLLPNVFRGYLNEIINRDSNGVNKNFFIGEYAPSDIDWAISSFRLGVSMARQQAAFTRVGISGLVKWALDDDSWETNTVKRHGFWSTVSDPTIRPAFYSWSLSCRLFPPGCQTLILPETNVPKLDIYAAKIADGNANDISITIINDTTISRSLVVKLPKVASPVTLAKYHYFDTDRPVDSNGFAIAKDTLIGVDLSQGVEITLPGKGVVFLTTMYLESNSISFKENLSFEAESLAITAIGVVADTIKESNASSDQWVILNSSEASGHCYFSVNVENEGTYFVGVRAKAAKRNGTYAMSVDDQPLGNPVDLFTMDSSIFCNTNHGSIHLSAGTHTFRFSVSGKNDLSEGFAIGIDRITLAETSDEILSDSVTSGGTMAEGVFDEPNPAIVVNSVFPNPFNPSTTIRYSVPVNEFHSVGVYNLHGTLVRTLFTGVHASLTNRVEWNGCDETGRTVSSGVYVIRIISGKGTLSSKVMMLR
jgi:hypothetical protein